MNNNKKKILYLGLDPSRYPEKVTHYPIIRTVPRPFDSKEMVRVFANFDHYTHLIFTSRTAVSILQERNLSFEKKVLIAVGKATAGLLERVDFVAQDERAEGIVELLMQLDLREGHLFWPHSALSRPVIRNFLEAAGIRYTDCILYDTLPNRVEPIPSLDEFDEIVFTSPSTINAFLDLFGSFPKDKILTAIGSVTENKLEKERKSHEKVYATQTAL